MSTKKVIQEMDATSKKIFTIIDDITGNIDKAKQNILYVGEDTITINTLLKEHLKDMVELNKNIELLSKYEVECI